MALIGDALSSGSSPHVRGALRGNGACPTGIRDHPRMCGEHRGVNNYNNPTRDHPRMCGEHEGKYEEDSDMPGSSPHVRGARNRDYCRRLDYGIIPACAGSTRGSTLSAPLARDHPRMCGEHAGQKFWFFTKQGSSPHVRGARALADAVGSCGGIIPACAGSTNETCWGMPHQWDHPRMCGEHVDDRCP